MKSISRMSKSDRPREKLLQKGPESLTDAELIAVLLGTGTEERDVLKVASAVTRHLARTRRSPTVSELREIHGLGAAKACQIAAAYEIGRRGAARDGKPLTGPESILPHISFIANKQQEYLVCVSLNGAGEVLACRVVTIGLLDSTSVHPREVFADPLTDRAAAVVLAHNHPSGTARPSRRDIRVHRRLTDAGRLLGITVLDHVILTAKEFFSFKKHGLL
ncbi:DNA repair protein RadC [bacterium]|nr:DNA repair protein RadC [bacterium]